MLFSFFFCLLKLELQKKAPLQNDEEIVSEKLDEISSCGRSFEKEYHNRYQVVNVVIWIVI